MAFLHDIGRRLKIEITEELQQMRSSIKEKPLLGLVHGPPGTGKNDVIKWTQRMFQETLGWKHGVQYVSLAFLNSIAANMDGFTIHSWAGIPVGEEDGTAGTKDIPKMSTRC